MLPKTPFETLISFLFPIAIIGQSPKAIQFYTYDNLPLITSIVEGKEGFLILDSGAEGLVLNIQYFNDDQNFDSNLTAQGFNGRLEKILLRKTNLQIDSNHRWNHIVVMVINLDHLTIGNDLPILGLVGFQLFEQYEILLDF